MEARTFLTLCLETPGGLFLMKQKRNLLNISTKRGSFISDMKSKGNFVIETKKYAAFAAE